MGCRDRSLCACEQEDTAWVDYPLPSTPPHPFQAQPSPAIDGEEGSSSAKGPRVAERSIERKGGDGVVSRQRAEISVEEITHADVPKSA
jgi:hypothetical protein